MKKNRQDNADIVELRRKAEALLKARKTKMPTETEVADPRRLLNELEVHQLELEIQNEELRAARLEVEIGLKRYTELFNFAPIGYFVIAIDGTIRELNLAGARLLGMERQLLVGLHFSQFVSEGHRTAFSEFLGRVLTKNTEAQSSESCELTLTRSPIEIHLTAAILEGSPPTALISVEDITRRKHAEKALREESRNKDAFLAVLSHELRNPLAPIRNSLFLLAQAEATKEQIRKAQAVIDRQVTHLTHIVDDLLDVTRIAQGKIRLQCEHMELGDLVRRTLSDHRPSFEAKEIQLKSHLESELFWVTADSTRLIQILENLLGNAAKFTSRGGKVEVFMQREGPTVALSVRDTGIGIDPEVRQRLFQPFSQAPQGLDRAHGGLGLGLMTVKGLIELHGGTVEVTSEGIGQGSEFTVRLPLKIGMPQVPLSIEKHQSRRYRVLVIEDNLDAADTLRDALELNGHDVQVTYDGSDGIALAKKFRPEIIICDIGLPGMDGYEVAHTLRADDTLKGAYLIALSGYAMPEDLRHAIKAGFDRHVAKPLSINKLEQLFEEVPAPPPPTQ